ncbi:L,D-transpeptidase [Streptacidiphilus sp. PAMC 29251]
MAPKGPRKAVAFVLLLAAAVLGGASACTPSPSPPAARPGQSGQSGQSGQGGQGAAPSASTAGTHPPVTITIDLAKNAAGDVLTDKPVRITVQGGSLASVTVADSKGDPVPGSTSLSAGTWTPASPFGVGARYTLTADATAQGDPSAQPTINRVGFTAATPAKTMTLDSITPAKGATVGVAMPISIVFSDPVAQANRAGVEKQLKVSASPAVTGSWHWFSDRRVDWRPKDFWKSGTKVTVAADLNGVNGGNGRYGKTDYQHSFTIGRDVEAVVDAPGHTMKVYLNGGLDRVLRVDTGKPGYETWGGTMAVIDKQASVVMNSCSVGIQCNPNGPNYYNQPFPWAVHLTGSGTYAHFSDGDSDPGLDNSSHGCIHLSLSDAKWFFDLVKQGDPVTVKGEPKNVAPDNGYADFTLGWARWTAGSALHNA